MNQTADTKTAGWIACDYNIIYFRLRVCVCVGWKRKEGRGRGVKKGGKK